MAKEITQIIERERSDGWTELTMVVTDSETGKQESGSTEWFSSGDRNVRVDKLRDDLLK